MSTPPRWTKEEPYPDPHPREVWRREDNGYTLGVSKGDLLFWWYVAGTEESGFKPTLRAAKYAATRALKRIIKRSEI